MLGVSISWNWWGFGVKLGGFRLVVGGLGVAGAWGLGECFMTRFGVFSRNRLKMCAKPVRLW